MKKLIILCLSLFIGHLAFSQEFVSTSKEEFLSYIHQQDEYYQNLIEQNNGSTEGIDGYKAYMRWKINYAEEAFNSNGMHNVIIAEKNFLTDFGNYKQSIATEQIEWEDLGPTRKPLFFRTEGLELYKNRFEGVGRIFSVEFDPTNSNRVFVGSPTGGLYYSEDHGETWINGGTDQIPNPGISHMKIIPALKNTPETWFILTGDADNYFWSGVYFRGVLRSQNMGQSWDTVSNGISTGIWNYGRKLLLNENNPNEMFLILSNGLYKSNNILDPNPGSVLWNKINDSDFSDQHFTDICYKPNSNYQTIYAATRDSIFCSVDGGLDFFPLPNMVDSMFLCDEH